MLTARDKQNIALLRFGSHNDWSQTKATITQVSKRLNINWNTVATFLRRLKEKGPTALQNCYFKRRPYPVGNSDVEMLLLSDTYLRRWACLSLLERAEQIRRKFNVTVAPDRLWRFYRRHEVVWRRTYMCSTASPRTGRKLS